MYAIYFTLLYIFYIDDVTLPFEYATMDSALKCVVSNLIGICCFNSKAIGEPKAADVASTPSNI